MESTINAFTVIIITAIPYTGTSLTAPLLTKYPEKSSFTRLTYKANSLHEIDNLHEYTPIERGEVD